jgi:hypothetical protein
MNGVNMVKLTNYELGIKVEKSDRKFQWRKPQSTNQLQTNYSVIFCNIVGGGTKAYST